MKLSATFSMFLACLLAPSALADASAQQHLRGRRLGSCKGVAPWDTPAQATWCEASCNHDPPHCPTSQCDCSAPETAPEPTPESLVCQCQCDDDTKMCTCPAGYTLTGSNEPKYEPPTECPPFTFDNDGLKKAVDLYTDAATKAEIVAIYGPIECWDTGEVTSMRQLFQLKRSFNEDIRGWDVSKVTNMFDMFNGATAFNKAIGAWDVSKVTNMWSMFKGASAFNQPIGSWDVSKVTNMRAMFFRASRFNQPIGSWDVSSVTDMYGMFYEAFAFSQDLSTWCVVKVSDYTNFGTGSDLTQAQLPVWGTCPA